MSFSQLAERPLVLLPVQLQARYVGDHLRIRVLPDLIHGDNHDTSLTAREIVAGTAFWSNLRSNVEAGDDEDMATTAERGRLASQVGPYRALWVADQTKPTNWALGTDAKGLIFPVLTPIDAHAPMRARMLPERWVARLYDEAGGLIDTYDTEHAIDQDLRLAPSLGQVTDDLEESDRADHVTEFLARQNLQWTISFSKAVAAGMAFEISTAGLPHRIGAIIVAGLRSGEGVLETANAFEELLEAHWYRRGVETLPQGTPTNNSDAGGTGFSVAAPDLDALFDADATRRPLSGLGRGVLIKKLPETLYQLPAADCQALSLGMIGPSVLDRGSHAETLEGLGGWAMNMALGYAMLGRYGTEILTHADGTTNVDFLPELRDHYSAWVRAGAHIPVLRVGPQPYGLLPITDPPPVYYGWSDDFEVKYDHYLSQLMDRFSRRIEAATLDPDATDARPGRTPEAQTEDVFDVLGAVAHPTNLQTRTLNDHALEDAATFNQIIADLDDAARNDSVPIGEDAQGNYIFYASDYWDPRKARLTGIPSPDVPNAFVYDIAAQWSQVQTLIAEVEAHAPSHIEGPMMDIINNRLIPLMNIYLDGTKSIPDLWAELFDGGGLSGSAPPAVRTRSFARLIAATFEEDTEAIPELVRGEAYDFEELMGVLQRGQDLLQKPPAPGNRKALVDREAPLLAHLINDTYQRVPEDQTGPVIAAFALMRARIASVMEEDGDLDALEAELSRMMRASLGLAMHRVDAWVTSRAAQALAQKRQKNPMGMQVGGYGILLDLVASDQPQSQGYIHASSMRQAVTAGMLRSGWTGYGTEAETKPLSTNLSSRATRKARALAHALEQGQDLGEVLGAMFERAVHDLQMDRWIDEVRLAVNTVAGFAHPEQQQVAGLLIARSGFADQTPQEIEAGKAFEDVLSTVPSADATRLRAARDEVGAALDSLSDLTIAQAVFSLAQGDTDTAGAAMSMTGGGDAVVPPLSALDTTRTARLVTHRVGLGLDPSVAGDEARLISMAEPAVYAWLGAHLPAAADVECRVDVLEGRKLRRLRVTLSALGMDNVTAALLADEVASQQDARLGRLILAHVKQDAAEGAQITLKTDRAGKRQLALDDFALMAAPLVRAFREARAMEPADLMAPGAELEAGAGTLTKQMLVRALEMQSHLNRWAETFKSAEDAAVIGFAAEALAMGVPGALAMAEAPGDGALRDAVIQEVSKRAKMMADLTLTGKDRLKAAIGSALPIVTPFLSGTENDVAAALSDTVRADFVLEHGDRWMRQVSSVRPALEPLATHAALFEALRDGDAFAPPSAVQLPHHDDEAWAAVALPAADSGDRVNMFLLGGGAALSNKETVGLIFDSWSEGIPKPDHQTGVAWHFDTPSARAPQSILIATTNRDVYDADTVFEQLRHVVTLMKMRAVGPDQLRYAPPGHLPQNENDPDYIEPAIGQFLPGTWLDVNAKLSGTDP